MNILILFSQPWRVGGAETHVEALLKGLKDHTVFLAVNEGSNEEKLDKLSRDYPYLRITKIQARGINFWQWYKDIIRLTELIQQEHIEVIAAQQRTAGIWAYFIAKKINVAYTVTMHDPWHRAKGKSIYPKLFPVIFAVSANLAVVLQEEFGFSQQQIKLINNGIDFTEFTPTPQDIARKKLNLANDKKIILHVSRLSNIKGAVSLKIIESMEAVVKENPSVQLLIVGEGPLRPIIEQKVAEFNDKFGEHIAIYDFVGDIVNWYNACDILIGEGRVAMEALACHKPIVAIRNAQYFIGAIDPQNLAVACDVNFDGKNQPVTPENIAKETMKALSQDSAESEWMAAYIKGRLSIEKMAEKYMQAFEELAQ